jgi:hypothetical protein
LTRTDADGAPTSFVQDRAHYVCATFRPLVPDAGPWDGAIKKLRDTAAAWTRGRRAGDGWQATYEALVEEASRFARRVEVGLSQMGLRFQRCDTCEITRLVYDLLNPTTSGVAQADSLSERARHERDGLPTTVLEEFPYAADTSPYGASTMTS